jgi:hypothetical protein
MCQVGTTAGGSMSALYGFNAVMPHVKKQIRGPIWFQLLVGLPPVMIFSVGCAGLAGGFLLFSCPKSGVRERELN